MPWRTHPLDRRSLPIKLACPRTLGAELSAFGFKTILEAERAKDTMVQLLVREASVSG